MRYAGSWLLTFLLLLFLGGCEGAGGPLSIRGIPSRADGGILSATIASDTPMSRGVQARVRDMDSVQVSVLLPDGSDSFQETVSWAQLATGAASVRFDGLPSGVATVCAIAFTAEGDNIGEARETVRIRPGHTTHVALDLTLDEDDGAIDATIKIHEPMGGGRGTPGAAGPHFVLHDPWQAATTSTQGAWRFQEWDGRTYSDLGFGRSPWGIDGWYSNRLSLVYVVREQLLFHPGRDTETALRWTAARSCEVNVEGEVTSTDTSWDGVRPQIFVDEGVVFERTLAGRASASFHFKRSLPAGSSIVFRLGNNGDFFADTTRFKIRLWEGLRGE